MELSGGQWAALVLVAGALVIGAKSVLQEQRQEEAAPAQRKAAAASLYHDTHDALAFEERCGIAAEVRNEKVVRGVPRGTLLLVYPTAGLRITFKGRHEADVMAFDRVEFFDTVLGQQIDPRAALQLLKCSGAPLG
jgi:hypothetical protein